MARQTRALAVWSFATMKMPPHSKKYIFSILTNNVKSHTSNELNIAILKHQTSRPKEFNTSIYSPTPKLCNNFYHMHKFNSNLENSYYKIYWTYTSHTAYFNPTRLISCMLIPVWFRISNNIKTHPKSITKIRWTFS